MGQIRNRKLLKNIAIVIKQLRTDLGLTQDEVYDATKIHIGRIETAKANLSISTLDALCEYFEMSLSEFFNRVESVD